MRIKRLFVLQLTKQPTCTRRSCFVFITSDNVQHGETGSLHFKPILRENLPNVPSISFLRTLKTKHMYKNLVQAFFFSYICRNPLYIAEVKCKRMFQTCFLC